MEHVQFFEDISQEYLKKNERIKQAHKHFIVTIWDEFDRT